MKIFVGYGFNERDKWIVEMVFPIVQAFGDEVVKGDELQGEQINDAIKKKIRESNALIGFATRRGEPYANNKWNTHRWVTDELSQAIANNLLLVEVREEGVDDQRGIMGDRQPIVYRESARDKCLVELVKTIGKWHEATSNATSIQFKLLPEEYIEELRRLLRQPDFRCTYTLLIKGVESPEIPAKILPITGGLFVIAKDVPRDALVRVHIEYQGRHWSSSFESIDSLGIKLLRE